ncbi:hypothetical protein O4H49_02910 [Kiloniella laminariae]|uniref:Uncharacterized protein n=1 Tax=Kiloniella laminariae TaxID=454162 RepID=A0ABT4LF36_9PROT|nr:hypothetical protein [Kiloniella laminariae]MCZ4279713.1 hypothetical protein [Kiloniella laminariae]
MLYKKNLEKSAWNATGKANAPGMIACAVIAGGIVFGFPDVLANKGKSKTEIRNRRESLNNSGSDKASIP